MPAPFVVVQTIAVGTGAHDVATADLNGDGVLDLVVSDENIGGPSGDVRVLLGDGIGGFSAAGSPISLTRPVGLAVGDFNADGRVDVVVGQDANQTVSVLLGNGNGGLTQASGSPITLNGTLDTVIVADFNRDGQPDFLAVDLNNNIFHVRLGAGGGTFTVGTAFTATFGAFPGPEPIFAAVGDMNNDGKLDVVSSGTSQNQVEILFGNGAGGLANGPIIPVGRTPEGIVLGDLNHDGNLDIVVADQLDNNVRVLLMDGNGGVLSTTLFATGSHPTQVALLDYNGDGNLDLAVTNTTSGTISILPGDGAGGFGAQTTVAVGVNPYGLIVGDFNGDGHPDLAVANNNGGGAGSVSILLNNGVAVSNGGGHLPGSDFTFTVTRFGATTGTASVDWSVAGSGSSPATAADFAGGTLPSGTVTFAAGVTTQTITVHTVAGHLSSSSDGFQVTLSNAVGTNLEGVAGTASIALSTDPAQGFAPPDGSDGVLRMGVGASFTAGGGDDVITAFGTDTLDAGAGNDEIIAQGANNNLSGGPGDDFINGSPGFDAINGGQGNDVIDGGAGGNDYILGGQGDDFILVRAGDNFLHGNLGNDTLTGGTGHDTLLGGQGDDVLRGGTGNDYLSGDLGNDTLTGGGGADTFHVAAHNGHEVITDFSAATGDKVQVDVGLSWTVSQGASGALVTFSDGTTVSLSGVTAGSLPTGWIFTL